MSVTTPADFDRSPLPLLPGEQPVAPLPKDEGTPVKDELYMTELSKNRLPEERTYEVSSLGEFDSQKQIEPSVGLSQDRREGLR